MNQLIAVIGASECEPIVATMAEEVGRGIAQMGVTLITGGRGGVMEAASKGAKLAGGLTIGVMPGRDYSEVNPYIDVPIISNLGAARNAVIVQSANAVIAVGGGYGTLSEIAIALKLGKPVIGIATWETPGVFKVGGPEQALVAAAEELAKQAL